eukprot:GAFH01006086.1.p1 GENE.GAFH01006086.1~~GAFH01006086.1.p1  ORF type:complete len:166 (+),score=28.60 GAFH01006086.1:2-499(+)
MANLVEALDYLHGQPLQGLPWPLLHNDLKPTNVLLRRGAAGDLDAFLTNFSMATEYSEHHPAPLAAHLPHFTPGFAAPELFQTGATPATDVYALGCILYCLYAGVDSAHIRTADAPPSPEERELAFAEMPDGLRDMLVNMGAHDPAQRPSIGNVYAALKAADSSS